jgi:AcrR family transcriptional regulator
VAGRKKRKSSLERRLDLLWDRDGRPGPGPKPGLTVDRIVAVAVELADRKGLEAVTMRSVADRLGVTTMALYRYFPGKEAVIDAMIQAALGRPPVQHYEHWRSGLEQWARDYRAIFERHHWLLDLATCAPVGPNFLAWLEALLRVLEGTSLTPQEIMAVGAVIDTHARNLAQIARGVLRDPRPLGTAEELQATFSRALERASDDARYPTMARLLAAGGFSEHGNEFEFGLARLLDGIGVLIEERTHHLAVTR